MTETPWRTGRYRPYGVPPRPPRTLDLEYGTWSLAAVLRILLEPASYFDELRARVTASRVSAFAMVHASVLAAVAYLAASLGAQSPGTEVWRYPHLMVVIAGAAMAAAVAGVAGLVVSHAVALAIHPVAVIAGGCGGYAATYGAVVYGAAPAALTLACGYCIATVAPAEATTGAWLAAAGILWSCAIAGLAMVVLHDLEGMGAGLGACSPLVLLVALVLGYHHMALVRPDATRATMTTAQALLEGALPQMPVQRTRHTVKRPTSGRHNGAQHRSRVAR